MSPLTSATVCSTLLIVGVFVFVSADQKSITAESGQNITLTCGAPKFNITVVEWSRDGLTDEYVLLYQNAKFVPHNQHPSFKNRVDLQDRQMKDGDVSLILKNVTINDTGTYECRVIQRGTSGLKLINSTYLSVVAPPGPTEGTTKDEGEENGAVGLIVGLSVFAGVLLVAAVVGFLIYRKCKCKQQSKPSDDL